MFYSLKKTKFIFYLLFALISSKAIAQNSAQNLTVFVRDSATYQPLSEALISIYNVDSMNVKPLNIVETKNKGRTQFNLSKNSNFRLCVSKKGYVNGEFLLYSSAKDSDTLGLNLIASEEDICLLYFNTFVHFGKNEVENNSDSANNVLNMFVNDKTNKENKWDVIGYSDYNEDQSSDLAYKRAKFIYDKLICLGANPDFLEIKTRYNEPFFIDGYYSFLSGNAFCIRDRLSKKYISTLPSYLQELAHLFNRRVIINSHKD
jgi:5-hydroxyisourate hydrolase-like protein (transthyretin family)